MAERMQREETVLATAQVLQQLPPLAVGNGDARRPRQPTLPMPQRPLRAHKLPLPTPRKRCRRTRLSPSNKLRRPPHIRVPLCPSPFLLLVVRAVRSLPCHPPRPCRRPWTTSNIVDRSRLHRTMLTRRIPAATCTASHSPVVSPGMVPALAHRLGRTMLRATTAVLLPLRRTRCHLSIRGGRSRVCSRGTITGEGNGCLHRSVLRLVCVDSM